MTRSLEAFRLYTAAKTYFNNPKYDFFHYNSKVRADAVSFQNRPDFYHFQKLSDFHDPLGLLIFHLVENPDVWIGTIVLDHAPYQKHRSTIDSLTQNFKEDLKKLDPDFDRNFRAQGDGFPLILGLLQQREISIETVCILSDLISCLDYWSKHYERNIFVAPVIFKVRRYLPFLKKFAKSSYDLKKFKDIVLEEYQTNTK